jgi:malonyl CoA-acyl carrier protein transacylase
MADGKVVLLFPGQGAFDGELLRAAHREYAEVEQVFATIDRVAVELFGRQLSTVLFGSRTVGIQDLVRDEPWVSQLAIYGSDLAAHAVLVGHGLRPDVLVGHSLGEIAALVAANAFSVEDGARVVAHRVLAVQGVGPDGYLAALATQVARAQLIVDLVQDPLVAVAAVNHDHQVVLSGSSSGMDTLQVIARHLGIGSVRLHSPFPFHSPILRPAVAEFADRIRGLDQRPLDIPVYSPILRRYYESDDVLADLLAEHLVAPVRFAEALRRVHADGGRVFVETGALSALSKLVGTVIPAGTTALSTLARGRADGSPDSVALADTLAALRAGGWLKGESVRKLGETLAPGVDAGVFAAFWVEHRGEISSLVADRVAAFARRTTVPATRTASPVRLVSVPAPSSPVRLSAVPTVSGPSSKLFRTIDRETLLAEIRTVYATALEYPEEVFTDDVLLEAELGVDSVKQIELMTRVAARYGISEQAQGLRLTDYDTMGKVVDFVHAASAGRALDRPFAATK